jgi:hypothetical protein
MIMSCAPLINPSSQDILRSEKDGVINHDTAAASSRENCNGSRSQVKRETDKQQAAKIVRSL